MNNGRIRTPILIVSLAIVAVVLFVAGLLQRKDSDSAAAENGAGGDTAAAAPGASPLAPGTRTTQAAPAPVTPASMGIQFYLSAEAAPAWTVHYGEEFWRRDPAPDAALQTEAQGGASLVQPPFSLGDVVERVSHAFEPGNALGLPVVTAGNYVARVDEQGLRFSPHRPASSEAEPEPRRVSKGSEEEAGAEAAAQSGRAGWPVPDAGTEALVRTLSIERGAEKFYAAGDGSVERAVVGNTAQGLLAPAWGVVEHFETGSEGVALSWVFPQPLPGTGPIEVTVALEGLTLAGTDGEGWHFADHSGQARVRFGAAVAVDAAGTRWDLDVQPALDENGRLVVSLPEVILVEAIYPLAIDPVISAEFGMGQPVALPSFGSENNATVAAASTQFLVVWEDDRHASSTGTDLYGARVSLGGKVLDPAGIAVATTYGSQSAPAVAVNGTTFLVVWRDTRLGIDDDVFGARISSAGVVLEPLGFAISTATDNQTVPAIASGAPGFMVVWEDDRNNATTDTDIYGARVSTAGVVLEPAGIPISIDANRQRRPAVGNSAGGFIVAWEDDRNNATSNTDIYGARVSDAGVLEDALGVPVSTALRAQTQPALASNGGRALAVWRDDRNNATSDDDIFGTILRSQGNQLTVDNTNGVAVCTNAAIQRSPAVGASGGGFCVAWRDERNAGTSDDDIYAARVNNNGVVQETNGVAICTAALDQSAPAVAGNSAGALIVWTDPRNTLTTANDIYGARFTAAGLLQDTNGVPVSLACAAQVNAAVAFNGTNYLVVWEDRRAVTNSGVDIIGARVTSVGKVTDLRGTNITTASSNQYNPSVAASGGQFLVVWQDERNLGTTDVDIYGTRVSATGFVMDPAGLALSTDGNVQTLPAVAGDGATFLVIWQDDRGGGGTGNDIYGTRVSSAGAISNPAGLAISTDGNEQTSPALAAGSSGFLAVWEDDRNGGFDIYGARITSAGAVLDAGGIAITTDGSDQTVPTVAGHGTNYLVAWTDDRSSGETDLDIYAGRVLGDGATPDGDGFAVCTVLRDQSNPALAAGPSGYVVAWQDQRGTSTGSEIFTARVATNGVVLDVSGVPMPGSGDVTGPALAGGGAGKFLVVGEGFRKNSFRVGGGVITPDAPKASLFVQFGAASYSVAEIGKFAKITIALKGKYSGVVTVDFATANWTATAGLDYAPLNGRVVFANKKTSVVVAIPIIDDALTEGAEVIALRLENPTGGALLGAAYDASLTIVDNEP